MEGNKVTVEEVLRHEVGVLANLRVPAALVTELGVPIEGCIRNLNLCIDALEEQRKMQDTLKEMEGKTDERDADV